MDALRLIGFALIVGLVVAGLDYYQQDKKHEGTLSANGYVETLKTRFALYHEELDAEAAERDRQKRWRAGGKPYMPVPDSELSRRAIMDSDFTLDAREGGGLKSVSEAARPLASKVAVQKAEIQAKKLDKAGWVYEKAGHTYWIEIKLRQEASADSLAGNIARSIDSMDFGASNYAPFGVIGGVAYFQFVEAEYSPIHLDVRKVWSMITAKVTDLTQPVGFQIYTGTLGLGEEIRVEMYTDAPEQDVRIFLSQLDYDGMNALLSRPVPGVGNEAVTDPDGGIERALQMAEVRAEFTRLRSEIAQLRIENINGLALLANTMAAQHGLPSDAFDLTANNIQSPDDLIQIGYRKGLAGLEIENADADGSGGSVFGRLFGKLTGGSEEKEVEPKSSSGLFGGLKSFFKGSETADASGKRVNEASEIRVNKGGAGSSGKCAFKDARKTCSLSGG